MTIIEQIKAEVERLKIQEPQSAEADGYNMAIADLLSIIEEKSEKPMNQEGLEEEISRYLREECSDDDDPSISDTARHFAKWSAEKFAKIIRANLTQIDKNVQSQFEHLYMGITESKMYGGYND